MKVVNNTKPGIKKELEFPKFLDVELDIIKTISEKYWFVTYSGDEKLGSNLFRYIFVKPTIYISQNFNLYRELVVIFSSFEDFQPRALDVIDKLDIQNLRLEEVCFIIISKDVNVATSMKEYLKSEKESRVIVPFSYDELVKNTDPEYFVNKMRSFFYARDLFGIQEPLKHELYFFGRQDIISELVNKHISGENAGIFGLRKTGKTSILYGVMRMLTSKNAISTMIDCQTLHNQSWNLALRTLTQSILTSNNLKVHLLDQNYNKYVNPGEAPEAFLSDIAIIVKEAKKSVLLIFDEIEHISYKTSISRGWRSGIEFIKFWQVIRSTFQNPILKGRFTYLLAGTNPSCVEIAMIGQTDNPIFQQFIPIYIPPFNYELTKEMIDRLGGYMGIVFTDEACTHILEDFGGHPLLMRQVCSYIHRKVTHRPIEIGTAEYMEHRNSFYKDQSGFAAYINMILAVLKEFYKDEYYMLELLAVNDIENFKGLVATDEAYIAHLKNYGVIEEDGTSIGYHFKIESIKDYLVQKNKYIVLQLDDASKRAEISERRNNIELKLRRLVRTTLLTKYGTEEAKKIVCKQLGIKPEDVVIYKDLFDPNKYDIYLKKLCEMIRSKYDDAFKQIFFSTSEIFYANATLLNSFRKPDAHAATITEEEFMKFRGVASWFEKILENFD